MVDLYDKTGREVMLNDVLKVFHFRGARRKRYYMYKQVLDVICDGARLRISHLGGDGSTFSQKINGDTLMDWEIVQGFHKGVSYEDRPKKVINIDKGE